MKRILRWLSASRVLLWPAYWLSGFVARDPRLWVFTSQNGRTFADNGKWLFLACAKDPRVRPVWLTRSRALAASLRARGFRAYHSAGPAGIACALRASLYVFDGSAGAMNLWFSRGAQLVNLWHGIPLKKIEADIPRTSRYYRHFSRWSARGIIQTVFQPYKMMTHHRLVATSERIGLLLASAFRMSPDRLLVTGYPRNDCLFNEAADREHPGDTASVEARFSRVVGYFPTFREHAAADHAYASWDWAALDEELRARNTLLIVKLHPTDKRRIAADQVENIRVLPASMDPYPLLRRLDALVTDYSSIYFDFLLLDRPVLFFPYDLVEYQRDDRGFYFDYDEMTPGPRARSFGELRQLICSMLDDYGTHAASWRASRARVAEICHTHPDGRSSVRLIEVLLRDSGGEFKGCEHPTTSAA